jgi:DNA polymerase
VTTQDLTTPWDELAAAVKVCTACPELAATRMSVVVGEARPPWPRLALVGEAPGAQEDAAGRPFVGRAGALLDMLLAEAGVGRADVAVLNVLKCRPPGNRVPRPAEVANCRPWLQRQLDLVAPAVTVALGLSATRWFLGRTPTLGEVRGRVHVVDGRQVLPTYHPSAAMRFGPAGAPLAALRADLRHAVSLVDAG